MERSTCSVLILECLVVLNLIIYFYFASAFINSFLNHQYYHLVYISKQAIRLEQQGGLQDLAAEIMVEGVVAKMLMGMLMLNSGDFSVSPGSKC